MNVDREDILKWCEHENEAIRRKLEGLHKDISFLTGKREVLLSLVEFLQEEWEEEENG